MKRSIVRSRLRKKALLKPGGEANVTAQGQKIAGFHQRNISFEIFL